ncbi:MAG TPA: AAA family ATPase [Anaeromyxobacteraceae bacterium]|nr:AAA family ATPase [Anaeromyxobacteraceae bacterium]
MTARVNAGEDPAIPGAPEGSLEALRRFFGTAAAARRATRPLARDAEVGLDLDGAPARFTMASGAPEVLPGPARDPDFALALPAEAVRRLTAGDAGVGGLGVAFFQLVRSRHPELRIRVRLHASTGRLLARGYLNVLALGGLEVAAWLLRAGVRGPLEALDRLRRR